MRTKVLTRLLLACALAGAVVGCGCSQEESSSPNDSALPVEVEAGDMVLESSVFEDKGEIPVRFARQGIDGGMNISIPFAWTDPPEGTESLALLMYDSHPAARRWIHWMVVDIPPETSGLPEGASGEDMPPGSVELSNTWGDAGYGGPEPPEGTGGHYYLTTVYALDVAEVDVAADADLRGFLKAIEGHVLAEANIEGSRGR